MTHSFAELGTDPGSVSELESILESETPTDSEFVRIEGQFARLNAVPILNNPYNRHTEPEYHEIWLSAWLQEDKEIRNG